MASKPKQDNNSENNPAVNLVRSKLNNIFQNEPNVSDEAKIIQADLPKISKHQQFLNDLLKNNSNYADVQTAWHNYYIQLPDHEKHQVWNEFYSKHSHKINHSPNSIASTNQEHYHKKDAKFSHVIESEDDKKTTAEVKKRITNKISANGKLKAKHHIKSLLFGFGMAGLFLILTSFTLFNQLFITPFIKPSTTASSTPLITDPNATINVGPENKIIIPKLNVEAPIIDDVPNIEEATIQKALEKGVVLYPNTGQPGQQGNQVIFGHSSNNLFNRGDFKYVFVLLGRLEKGDAILINYQNKQYAYKVIDKRIIKPTDVGILDERPVPSLVTLITCDPPGANINRLVIQAEQISPDPSNNTKSEVAEAKPAPKVLAGNPESLWSRLVNWIF